MPVVDLAIMHHHDKGKAKVLGFVQICRGRKFRIFLPPLLAKIKKLGGFAFFRIG